MNCLNNMEFRKELLALQDLEYKAFHSRLMPNISEERIIGVRTPALRSLAKRAANTMEAETFLRSIPHYYYEENNLHGALIDYGKYDFDETICLIEAFLPLIDNWATCDMFIPKIFKKYPEKLLPFIKKWLKSDHTYTIRFGVNCLMHVFLEKEFDPIHFEWINEIKNDDYYVRMGIAWYYSVALVKQWDATFALLQRRLPDPWIQNKSIQKARESYRITQEKKRILNYYKIKETNYDG